MFVILSYRINWQSKKNNSRVSWSWILVSQSIHIRTTGIVFEFSKYLFMVVDQFLRMEKKRGRVYWGVKRQNYLDKVEGSLYVEDIHMATFEKFVDTGIN